MVECYFESDQGDALLSLFVDDLFCLWLHKTHKRVSIMLMCVFGYMSPCITNVFHPASGTKRNTCWRFPSIDVAMPWHSGSFLFFFIFLFFFLFSHVIYEEAVREKKDIVEWYESERERAKEVFFYLSMVMGDRRGREKCLMFVDTCLHAC